MIFLKKKDKVVVLSGRDRGKQGELLKILLPRGSSEGRRGFLRGSRRFRQLPRAIVSKLNFAKKHTRATQNEPGGILEKEMPIPLSRLMLICPKCSQPTRPKIQSISGEKSRLCRHCGEMII